MKQMFQKRHQKGNFPSFPPQQGSSQSSTLPVTRKAWSPEPTGPWQVQGPNGWICLPLWRSAELKKKKKNLDSSIKTGNWRSNASNDKWFEIVSRCLCKNGGGRTFAKIEGKRCAKLLFGIKETFFCKYIFFPWMAWLYFSGFFNLRDWTVHFLYWHTQKASPYHLWEKNEKKNEEQEIGICKVLVGSFKYI